MAGLCIIGAIVGGRGRRAYRARPRRSAPQGRDGAFARKPDRAPAVHFHYDDSVDRGERIEALLRSNLPS
ncbi:MAG: hypothetical protein QM601_05235 [Pseudoxanthomonas sp.]